ASQLLHYTTLHLQPWQPTPEQYSYHPHPLGELWLRLEREADIDGYQPFSRAQPSAGYHRLMAEQHGAAVPTAALPPGVREFLADLGIDDRPQLCILAGPPAEPVQAMVVTGLLERLPVEDIPWFLNALFALVRRAIHLQIDLRQAAVAGDRPLPARLRRPATWWRHCLAAAAQRHPAVAWQLDLIETGGARRRFRYLPLKGSPRVWVLLGRHEGDNKQLLALAEALGWPYQTRQLVFKEGPTVPPWVQGASLLRLDRGRSEPLIAPWPDLVLAAGGRSAPVARWIRRRSGGAARLVHLGRPRAPLKAFDLVVTTPQYRLPARENVLHNVLPLNRPLSQQTERAVAAWRQRLASLPRPWIALLVGGNSSSCVLSEETARQLRAQAAALVRRRGGSLLIATSPRTPAAAADILLADSLLADSELPGLRYRWRANDPNNPYSAFLELADEFVVTGDSASMIADACAGGRPVRYVALPRPTPRRRLYPVALLHKLMERRQGQLGERGTPRQQDALGRWLDTLIASGLLRPPRDLTPLHEALRWSGLAQPLDDPQPAILSPAGTDLERAVAAVRRLFLRGRTVRP
ncbi:MAG: mitochondrial fission ELM1 family protein, partial [Porticoccaceae bacterium]